MPTPIKAPEIIYILLSNNSNVSGIISIISNKIRDEKAMPIEKQITFLLPLFILLITTPIRKINQQLMLIIILSFVSPFKKRLYSLYSAVSLIISAFIVTFTFNVPFNNSI